MARREQVRVRAALQAGAASAAASRRRRMWTPRAPAQSPPSPQDMERNAARATTLRLGACDDSSDSDDNGAGADGWSSSSSPGASYSSDDGDGDEPRRALFRHNGGTRESACSRSANGAGHIASSPSSQRRPRMRLAAASQLLVDSPRGVASIPQGQQRTPRRREAAASHRGHLSPQRQPHAVVVRTEAQRVLDDQLRQAAEAGRGQRVTTLLSHGAQLHGVTSKTGLSALHYAVFGGHHGVADILLSFEIQTTKGTQGNSQAPLVNAADAVRMRVFTRWVRLLVALAAAG